MMLKTSIKESSGNGRESNEPNKGSNKNSAFSVFGFSLGDALTKARYLFLTLVFVLPLKNVEIIFHCDPN